MISSGVEIRLDAISPADVRTAVDSHQLSLDWSGDSFMADHWLEGEHRSVVVDGEAVGVVGWSEDGLSLLTLSPAARRHDRQAAEVVLRESGARTAYVASWDAHHLAVLGAFATGIASQAYQFRLVDRDDLREPAAGLSLRPATAEDLPWLESTGFQDDYRQLLDGNALSLAVLDGAEAGIAVHVRHVLAQGGRPVAGCWWRNWASRVTLEAAGLTCAGTIFRLELDPHVFADAGGFEARA